jgi:hypothetical protein
VHDLSIRHCEHSEAIHPSACRAMDCFAALAMTWIGHGVLGTPLSRGTTIDALIEFEQHLNLFQCRKTGYACAAH